ncbi:hypothetical protein UlMin_004886 [Ulmus minor]
MIVFHKLISLLLLIFLTQTTLNVCGSNNILCFQTERKALLSFKQYLKDPLERLSSWVAEEENCCKWDGIVCDNITGHVQELHLANYSLTGKIYSSLLDLKQLSHLDLSYNDFEGTQIPNFIGSLVSLRYLNLKFARFEGVIPYQLGNLSSLHHLGLGDADCYWCGFSQLYVENLHWLSSLSLLEFLDMSGVNLSKASDHWLHAINKFPSLLELHLSCCELGHIHPLSYTNFTSLSFVAMSFNNFNSFIPNWVFNLSSLVELNLSWAKFIGSFPNDSFSLTSLTRLDVYGNSLSYTIPNYFYGFSNLKYLDLGVNKLQGVVSNSIQNLTSLVHLDLSRNKLNGSLPESLGSLSSLQFLHISNNLFEGVVSEVHFVNLTNLRFLKASGNSLSIRVNPDWIPPFHLEYLKLGSWNLGSQFPTWLKSQKGIRQIDLSNTGISEAIPIWFLNLSTSFDYINLCENQISGEIPSVPSIVVMRLCSNKFKGPLPSMSFRAVELDLSNNFLSGDISESLCHPTSDSRALSTLRLGGNLLSGNIPDCWMYYPSLTVIDLSNNNLTGAIPNSMGSLRWLFSLHLRNNSLSGEISSSFWNCTDLWILDLGLNKFVGSIPNWIGIRLLNLRILIIRSNKLNNHIPIELCHLTSLQILDAANNNLSGIIPRCFNNFRQMATKNQLDVTSISYYSDHYHQWLVSAIVVTKGREE